MTQLVHASVSPASWISAQEKFAKRTQFAIPFTKGAFPANESSQSADFLRSKQKRSKQIYKTNPFSPWSSWTEGLSAAFVRAARHSCLCPPPCCSEESRQCGHAGARALLSRCARRHDAEEHVLVAEAAGMRGETRRKHVGVRDTRDVD